LPEPIEEFSSFYCIDADDCISAVGGQWNAFAEANGGEKAVADRVTGTSLYDHVHGDVSRMYVRSVFAAVRTLARPAVRAYRCDSPRQKRHMEMRITPGADGSLRVEHRILRVEALPIAVRFVVGGTGRPCVRCSMCCRIKTGATWQDEIDHFARDQRTEVPVVYGVCPTCLAGIRRQHPADAAA
jgi:hypothetical protein